jgi:phospholipid/cholesterol/gamma-HCH transport system substrate-binding protein
MHQVDYQKRGIVTGMFIVIGLIAVTLSLFLSNDGMSLFDTKMVLFTELAQAQGISSGSLVALNGVNVGNVEKVDISLSDVRKIRVTLKIDNRFNNKLPKDSVIELRTQGALGDRYLQITPGESREYLTSGDTIQAKQSKDIIDLISEKGGEAQKVFIFFDEIIALLKALNEGQRLTHILTNTQDATKEIKLLTSEIRQLVKNLETQDRKILSETLLKLNAIADKIDRGQGTLGALINDPSLHKQLKEILGKSSGQNKLETLYQQNLQFRNTK